MRSKPPFNEFPKGHPIHEVPLTPKDQFGNVLTDPEDIKQFWKERRAMGAVKRQEKPAWVLKQRRTKEWYISYQDGVVKLMIGSPINRAMKLLWQNMVKDLNTNEVHPSVDLRMFGIV